MGMTHVPVNSSLVPQLGIYIDNDGGASVKLGVCNDNGESCKSVKFVHKNVHCVCVWIMYMI